MVGRKRHELGAEQRIMPRGEDFEFVFRIRCCGGIQRKADEESFLDMCFIAVSGDRAVPGRSMRVKVVTGSWPPTAAASARSSPNSVLTRFRYSTSTVTR